MAPSVLAARKREYVQALNRFIEMKKPYVSGGTTKARRPGEAASPKAPLSQSEQYEGELNRFVRDRWSRSRHWSCTHVHAMIGRVPIMSRSCHHKAHHCQTHRFCFLPTLDPLL